MENNKRCVLFAITIGCPANSNCRSSAYLILAHLFKTLLTSSSVKCYYSVFLLGNKPESSKKIKDEPSAEPSFKVA